MILSTGQKLLFYVLLIISALLLAGPAIMAIVMSFMTNQDILTGSLPTKFTIENYIAAFNGFPLTEYLFNSFTVSFVIMLGQLILSSLAAYAFVFIEFKGRDLLFYLFIATMMVPFEASIIPNFHLIRDLDWIDTYPGLTIPFLRQRSVPSCSGKILKEYQKNYVKPVRLLVWEISSSS